jgi:hypothetical protein
VRQKLLASGLNTRIARGHRIAITAGSRGIGGLIELLKGIAGAVTDCGGDPFVIPAMGSHGGATADGQTEILRRLGVTESTVGAPIRVTMETVDVGVSESGAVAHVDRLAFEADGIIVLGRVKTHPESVGTLASGLLKMCTIGLGKQVGAYEAHSHGLWPSVASVPKLQLSRAHILCGVAVVENGYRQPCAIEVVPPTYDAFLDADVSIAVSLIETICDELPALGDVRVTMVNLRIGALSGVSPDALTFAFDLATDNTRIAGAQLHIEHADGRELELTSLEVLDAAEDCRSS